MNKKHNFWGDPDEEPLPDWMNPETYRNGGKPKRRGKSLEESINEVLRKPPMIQEGMHIPLQGNNNDSN